MQASSPFYRRLIDQSPDAIIVCAGWRIIATNPAADTLFGGDIVGLEVLPLFAPVSRPVIQEWLQAVRPDVRATLQVTAGGGTTREVDASPAALGVDEVQLTLRDVPEERQALAALQESEERLRLAFAGAQEGVWDWNLDSGDVVYSRRWKEMLGYADDEVEPHVRAWERLIHPDDKERALAATERLSAGANAYHVECRLRHRDGHYVDILSRGFPVREAGTGRVVRIVGTHLDLTERRQAEEARRQAQVDRTRRELLGRLVFAQEDERRRIAREMHDQFGEHLTALARGVERLRVLAGTDARLADEVRLLDDVSQRLDRDVEHLVWELRPTALDDLGLRAALSNYIKDWSSRTGLAVEVHTSGLLEGRLPSEVETTVYRIAQEALTNVARHAQATRVEVVLERRPDAVILAIEDNGIGFDTGEGEPLGNERPAPTDDEGDRAEEDRRGPGARSFGLLGMRERAALVGASLAVESSRGQGTAVIFRLTTAALNTLDAGRQA